MFGLWKNNRGAVTVLVTLLLIPSLLLTGTAVDVSRIYAAKSILADADSLAANAALASYDALLQDMYGLYGYVYDANDAKLSRMLNDYIETAVFGDEYTKQGPTTLQLFYSQDRTVDTVFQKAKDLGDVKAMRRQIEEYMKLRAPVIIVEKLLDTLDSLEKVHADAEAIKQKMDIDENVDDIQKAYKIIYNLIQELDAYPNPRAGGGCLYGVNMRLDAIHAQIVQLYETREVWEEKNWDADNPFSQDRAGDYENKYSGIFQNIQALVDAGDCYRKYEEGDYNEEGEFEKGEWVNPYTVTSVGSLKYYAADGVTKAEKYASILEQLEKCLREVEETKANLKQKLETLRSQLARCSDGMKDGMQKGQEAYGGKSMLELYEALLDYDLIQIAREVHEKNFEVFDELGKVMSEAGYGNFLQIGIAGADTPIIHPDRLMELEKVMGFDLKYRVSLYTGNGSKTDYLKLYKNLTTSQYHLALERNYTPFQKVSDTSSKFYEMLVNFFGEDSSESKDGSKQKSNITKALKEIQKKIKEFYREAFNDPIGAYSYKEAAADTEESDALGDGADWESDRDAKASVKKTLDNQFIKKFANLANDAVNKLLLLTYDVEMFSNYATNKPLEEGKNEENPKAETSLTGVPFGVEVNYFYQSEQEYLFHGQKDAKSNLRAVTGAILLIRFVCNYIASFSVKEVNALVKNLMAAIPVPFNFAVAELARFAIVLGQSFVDVMGLRGGKEVPLLHNNSTWTLSISGIISGAAEIGEEIAKASSEGVPLEKAANLNKNQLDAAKESSLKAKTFGLQYSDYMMLLLLLVNRDTLAVRTKELIEYNLTNYKNGVGAEGSRRAREIKMSGLSLENMNHYVTGFSITTSIKMDTLFFPMKAAQQGINGVRPDSQYTIRDVVYRGY